jgi:hypothetical protein
MMQLPMKIVFFRPSMLPSDN